MAYYTAIWVFIEQIFIVYRNKCLRLSFIHFEISFIFCRNWLQRSLNANAYVHCVTENFTYYEKIHLHTLLSLFHQNLTTKSYWSFTCKIQMLHLNFIFFSFILFCFYTNISREISLNAIISTYALEVASYGANLTHEANQTHPLVRIELGSNEKYSNKPIT